MKNILALDIGDARIGVAIGFEETKNCFPLKAINASNSNNAKEEIKKLILEKEISILVVGLPLNENNEETTTSKRIRNFASSIKNNLNKDHTINIVFVDEYYSSQEALERLNLKLKDKKTRDKGTVDSMSATIILERYFEKEGIIV